MIGSDFWIDVMFENVDRHFFIYPTKTKMGNQEATMSGVWEKCGDVVYFELHQTFGEINLKTRTLTDSKDGTKIKSKMKSPKSFHASMNQVIAMVKDSNNRSRSQYLFEKRVMAWFEAKQKVHNHRQVVANK